MFKYWTKALGFISDNLTSGPRLQNAFVTWSKVRDMEKFLATAQMENHQAIKVEFPNTKTPVNTRSSGIQQKELFTAAKQYGIIRGSENSKNCYS